MIAADSLEWAEYGLDVLRVLVWPTVVVVLALVFKSQLSDVISRLREVGGFGVSGKFADRIERVADEVDDLIESEDARSRSTGEPSDDELGEDLTESVPDPTLRFLWAWSDLERNLRQWTKRNTSPGSYARSLRKRGLLSNEALDAVQELQAIRNEVAHGRRRLDESTAERLIDSTRAINYVLGDVAPNDGPPSEHIFDR